VREALGLPGRRVMPRAEAAPGAWALAVGGSRSGGSARLGEARPWGRGGEGKALVTQPMTRFRETIPGGHLKRGETTINSRRVISHITPPPSPNVKPPRLYIWVEISRTSEVGLYIWGALCIWKGIMFFDQKRYPKIHWALRAGIS